MIKFEKNERNSNAFMNVSYNKANVVVTWLIRADCNANIFTKQFVKLKVLFKNKVLHTNKLRGSQISNSKTQWKSVRILFGDL